MMQERALFLPLIVRANWQNGRKPKRNRQAGWDQREAADLRVAHSSTIQTGLHCLLLLSSTYP